MSDVGRQMSDVGKVNPASDIRNPHSDMLLLVSLFLASGAAALIYEIVWFQLLQLVIGSTAVSLAVLLGTFMGGMCLGSLALPRIVSRRHHPLFIYALLETGIAICGLVLLFLVPSLSGALVSAICLLPPTLFMGATLPAVARWVEDTSRLGFLYAANIAGAVFGSLFAGFYLLPVYDMAVATYVAAGINTSIAIVALLLGKIEGRSKNHLTVRDFSSVPQFLLRPQIPYFVIALSGLCALGAEVVWTRLLSLILGASVYTFSIIVAVFLLGLGIGSGVGASLSKRSANPRRALGICQALVAAAIAWSAYMLAEVLPYQQAALTVNFGLDLVRSMLAVLPAACLWGASFPLALAAAAPGARDPSRLVAGVYAANTVGAILGAVSFSVFVVQRLGTQHAQQALIAISVIAALLAFASAARRWALIAALGGLAVMFLVPPVPANLIAYGRSLPLTRSQPEIAKIVYAGEGMNASVAVSESPAGARNFHVSGKIEASTAPEDMRLQRMLGHLPGLMHSRPRSVLIVGFGAGVTAGSFVHHPSVERIVICEIEPLIPRAVASYFAAQNYNVVADPRVEMIYDDARHYLLTTDEKFDVITSDPIHPWVKGAAALYTREYFELVRRHLNPGGVVSQWVPLYQSSTDVVKSALATFFEVFPGGSVWSNTSAGRGYDIVLIGRDSNMPIDAAEFETRLSRRDHVNVLKSLQDVGLGSARDFFATYAISGSELAPWLAGAEINRDRNLRLQYTAGMGLHLDEGAQIYQSMMEHRERSQPRSLEPSQAASITRGLAAQPSRPISIRAVVGDEEALRYANALREAIAAGGWTVDRVDQVSFSAPVRGLMISVGSDPAPPAANELFTVLRSAGLTVNGNIDPNAEPESVSLVVGARP